MMVSRLFGFVWLTVLCLQRSHSPPHLFTCIQELTNSLLTGEQSGFSSQHSQHVTYLEKANRELTLAHQDAVKQLGSAQRDLSVLEKQLAARKYACNTLLNSQINHL